MVRPFGSFGQTQLATPEPLGVTTKQCRYLNIIIKHRIIVHVVFFCSLNIRVNFIEGMTSILAKSSNFLLSISFGLLCQRAQSGLAGWFRYYDLDST